MLSRVALVAKNPPAKAGDSGDADSSLGWEDLVEQMTTSRRILRAEETGGLQSMGLQRLGHDWVHTHTQCQNRKVLYTSFNMCIPQ